MSTPYYAGNHAYSFKFNNGGNPLANVEAGEDSRVRTDPQARTEVFNVWGTLYIAVEMYERWDKKMEFIDQSTGETFFRTHNQITQGYGNPATGELRGRALEMKHTKENKILIVKSKRDDDLNK